MFANARFLAALQTSQTVGCHRVGKSLARLAVAFGSQTRSDPRVHSELTFMTLFTYSIGPSIENWNWSRTSLARALNPVPGNQSGIYRTVQGFVNCLWMPDWVDRYTHMGMASTRNFPGIRATPSVRDASKTAARYGSSADLGSIPYVTERMIAPVVLRNEHAY